MAAVVGIFGIVLQYAIDKYILLRWSKRSRPQNAVQAMWCVRLIKMMGPLAITVGVVIFLMPAWSNKRQVFGFFILSLTVSLCVAILPFRCWTWGFLCRCCTQWQLRKIVVESSDKDYYAAQYMRPKEMKYHMDQYLYRQLNMADRQKCPEFRREDTDHRSRTSDLQAQSGDAMRQIAEDTSRKKGRNKRRGGRAFVGGHVVDVTDEAASRLTEHAAKEDGSATSYICVRPGCNRPTWNGTPGTFCGRTCRDTAIRGGAVVEAMTTNEIGPVQS